ncbi:hypothetical protein G9A89_022174 [Geosiphon pyriformis]|nr:hypothetical protein G9A89_022174 [Geosiphon pyriformis]
MMMSTSSKLLVATFKAFLSHGFHKKPMPMSSTELSDKYQQMQEKTIPLLLSERRTQGPGEVVTKYAKAIRKLIKQVDSGRN